MSKKISCGIVVCSDDGHILCGHATNQSFWDIFKGQRDKDESELDAALRETKEETGLDLSGAKLFDLGLVAYSQKKDLHLFRHVTEPCSILPGQLVCHSMVEHVTPPFPEMDAYAWLSFPEFLGKTAPSMNHLMKTLAAEGKIPCPFPVEMWRDVPPVVRTKNFFRKK